MSFKPTAIPDVVLVVPPRYGDERGFFSETWSRRAFERAGLTVDFLQDNHSLSRDRYTMRGLHFQKPPTAQDKLVRVVRGRVLDVAVDIRRSSPTYGKWVGAELTAEGGEQLFVPVGFAHGFLTLEPDTEVLYKVSAPYSREDEGGLCFADATLAIDWGVDADDVVANERDRTFPSFAEFDTPFSA